MKLLWLSLFVGSLLLLLIVLFRAKLSFRWISFVMLNIALAAVALYVLGWLEPLIHVRLPINAVTVMTVGILGIPGLLLLFGLKLTVI